MIQLFSFFCNSITRKLGGNLFILSDTVLSSNIADVKLAK